MSEKHICVITGTRAEYGILKLIIQKIQASKKLKLSLLVTGMHLLKKYGHTIDIIKKDNIPIIKVIPMYENDGSRKDSLGLSLGNAIINFTIAFNELQPDILLVLGDRYEPLAAVLAATTLSIPIAHIHGGDNVVNGQVDEQIRHSITKFAHIHFPATKKSFERIKLMGEEEWRIFKVGSPTVDIIYQEQLLNKEEICQKLSLNPLEKIVLCIQHSYIIEPTLAGEQMKLTLKVLKDLNLQTVIIYPNNDPGSNLIIDEIESNKGVPNFKIFKNLDRNLYFSLLKNVDLFIGNSSSGLIESPIFKIPVVNIGNRNKGRESAENIVNVPYIYSEIKKGIEICFSKEFKKICQNIKNPYGEGKASERIVKILEELHITKDLLIKNLTFSI